MAAALIAVTAWLERRLLHWRPEHGARGDRVSRMVARIARRAVLTGLLVVALAACGPRSKEDIVQKARNVSTRAELEKVLGQPSDIDRLDRADHRESDLRHAGHSGAQVADRQSDGLQDGECIVDLRAARFAMSSTTPPAAWT